MNNLSTWHLPHQTSLLHEDARAWLITPHDVITGTAGDDTLSGTSGKDTIDGLAGADLMSGGGKADVYIVDNVGDVISEAAGQGKDTVQSSVTYTLAANVENLTMTGSINGLTGTGNDLANNITGNSGISYLYGGLGNDTMNGGGNGDKLYGEGGDDTLYADGAGGGGGDSVYGGDGNDKIISSGAIYLGDGGAGDDTLVGGTGRFGSFHGGDGDDLVKGIGDNRPDILYGDAGNDRLLAGTGEDRVDGGAGDDWLSGGGCQTAGEEDLLWGSSGMDTLVSNVGLDRMYGGPDADLFRMRESSSFGDLIMDFEAGIDRFAIDQSEIAVGNGNNVIDGAVTVPGAGGFSTSAELVIVSSGTTIGSATSNYAVGDTVIFKVGQEVFLFTSSDNDAQVEASELDTVANLVGNPSVGVSDFIFIA